MADVASSLKSWSTTLSSNNPASSTTVGTGLAPNLQQIQATLRYELGTRSAAITAAATTDLSTKDEGIVLVSNSAGTVAITSFGTLSAGMHKLVTFSVTGGSLSITYNATSMILPGSANITVADGDSLYAESLGSGNWKVHAYHKASGLPASTTGLAASGANSDITSLSGLTTALSTAQGGTGAKTGAILRSYLAGLTLSTAGASATMSISAGQATDSTNVDLLTLSAIAKTTSAWAVGSAVGGLDTGAIANSTWYYFYVIRRPDTGVVDAIFSLSSSAPTLPTNYTQYRYIGAGLTNGSAQWTSFTQSGDEFWWSTPVLDFNGAGSATASLLTCSVPRGRKVKGFFNATGAASTGGAGFIYLSDPTNADLAPAINSNPLSTVAFNGAAATTIAGQGSCWTNTSAQIRHREVNSSNTYSIATLGWLDLRDRSA